MKIGTRFCKGILTINLDEEGNMKRKIQAVFLFFVFFMLFPTVCLTAEISREVARQVAENYLNHYQEV